MAVTWATTLADFTSGIGIAGAILQVDNANQKIGIGTTAPGGMPWVLPLRWMAPLVLYSNQVCWRRISVNRCIWSWTALSNDTTNVLSKVFFVNNTLDITAITTVTAPSSATQSNDSLDVAYTNFNEVNISDTVDLVISDGTDFVLDVLQLR